LLHGAHPEVIDGDSVIQFDKSNTKNDKRNIMTLNFLNELILVDEEHDFFILMWQNKLELFVRTLP
jgi:hypothetical protein